MSTNANLPAGQFITTIDGKQCTAIPRSTTSAQAAARTTSSSKATATTTTAQADTTAAQAQSSAPPDTVQSGAATTSSSVAVISTTTPPPAATTPPPAATTTPPPTAATTPAASAALDTSTSTPEATTSTTSDPVESIADTPATSSSPAPTATLVPIPQSELSVSSTTEVSTSSIDNQNGPASNLVTSSSTPSITSAAASTVGGSADAQQSSAGGGTVSAKTVSMPMIVGVVGSLAFVGIIGLVFWFFRRRRRYRRDSLLSPLRTNTSRDFGDEKALYEIDNGSVGPTRRTEKWRAQAGYQTRKMRSAAAGWKAGMLGFGTSLKAKVLPEGSPTPNVNLNRGNSQFLDGPIPQHSRSNSSLSPVSLTAKDRLNDWWERFTDNVAFKRRVRRQKEPSDPFAAARSMSEQRARSNVGTSDFSQLLGMDDRELQLQAERRRASLTNSVPTLGSLGLDFTSLDPFADPSPDTAAKKPFADPITEPGATIPKTQTYMADIRRSRGQSIDATTTSNNASAYAANTASFTRPPSGAVTSRYPSTIAPSRDSYRDTVFSSFSTNVRKGKGRSDPFDLERVELWSPPAMPKPDERVTAGMASRDSTLSEMRESAMPSALNVGGSQARVVSGAASSKYSSGVSSLGDWGDPGPDVGSESSSLRQASEESPTYGSHGWRVDEMMTREGERGGSPVSDVSSRFGVGKAR